MIINGLGNTMIRLVDKEGNDNQWLGHNTMIRLVDKEGNDTMAWANTMIRLVDKEGNHGLGTTQ